MVAGQRAKLPKLKDHKILALDIGTRFIKAAELRLNRGVITLENVVVCPTPPDTLDKSQILDPVMLGQAIKQLLLTNKIATRKVILSLRGQSSVVVRPIDLPRMTRKELAETMKFEVERHVPFAANEVIMDYAPLVAPEEVPDTEENMKVLLAVAQEELVNAYIKVLKSAKLKPVAFDVEILSAIRALVDIRQDEGSYDETVAMVNIGASATDISIVHQGNLVFNRSVPIAGDALTSAIAEQMGRSFDEAEELKIEHGKVFLDPAVGELPAPETAPESAPAAPPAQEATVAWESSGPLPQQIFSLDESFDTQGPFTPSGLAPAPAADATAAKPVFQLDADEAPAPEPVPEPAPAAPATGNGNGQGAPVFDLSSELSGQLPPSPRPRASTEDEESEIASPFAFAQSAPAPEAASQPEAPAAPAATPAPAAKAWGEMKSGDASQEAMFQRQVFEAMLPTLGEMVVEIQRSLEFYSTREPKDPITRILLYGGTSRLPQLAEFIHQELGVDVLSADPLQALELTPCQLPAEYLHDLAPALPVCVGLGLRDMIA